MKQLAVEFAASLGDPAVSETWSGRWIGRKRQAASTPLRQAVGA
jgi:hypothetical protein